MKVDYSDMVEKGLFTFFVIRFLRMYYDTPKRFPEQDKLLKKTWLFVIPLFLVANIPGLRFINDWYYQVFILVGAYFIYRARYNRNTRVLFTAVLPVVIMIGINTFFKLIFPSFHKEYDEIFGSAYGFAFFWMIGFGFYAHRQNKEEQTQRQKAEEERLRSEAKKQELEYQVAERTAELTRQKNELEETIAELKSTQNQLVQAEKMASLGELTAGIAHEIQNPLNFVNNFSEVSTELIDEMKEELERGDTEEVKAIADDLQQNLQKIVHHGKRASSIVKGMLEHSRMGTGERQLTDINALCDEYLRLSYHGMRAKDKSFNAEFELITEPDLPRISVVSQDVGRVLLNLINNAFYAVNVTRASSPSFKPKVSVLTEKSDNQLIIKVKDNGAGMSDKVKAKIFQPFFTTKPTGQGTGLGLSLAYDIITKGHGGKIEVESAEGNGTTFTIRLPITTAPIAVS